MPHTYPSPLQRRDAQAPLLSPFSSDDPPRVSSSKYLSPGQQARILSWRSNTSVASLDHPSEPKVKSAPASINRLSPTCQSPCTICAAKSSCSCSTQSSPNRPKYRGYYSNKNKKSSRTNQTAASNMPVTPPNPTPEGSKMGFSPRQFEAYHAGTAPGLQYGEISAVPSPKRVIAVPPKVDLPRIAGARDPISQN